MKYILTAEAEEPEFGFQIIAVCASISECCEMAAADLAGRLRDLEAGLDPGLCPYEYPVHAMRTSRGYGRVGAVNTNGNYRPDADVKWAEFDLSVNTPPKKVFEFGL